MSTSSSENFEYAQSRSWDILAVAMGVGSVGLAVGLGAHQFLGKGHKLDPSNVNGGKSPKTGAGAGGATDTSPSWTQHNSFSSPRYGTKGMKMRKSQTAQIGQAPMFPFDNDFTQSTSNVQQVGSVSSRTNMVNKKLNQVSYGVDVKIGGRSAGSLPGVTEAITPDSYWRAKLAPLYKTPAQAKDAFDMLGLSNKSSVVKAGKRMGVIPALALPTSTNGKLGYKLHSVSDLVTRALNVTSDAYQTLNSPGSKRIGGTLDSFFKYHDPHKVAKALVSLVKDNTLFPVYTKELGIKELASVLTPSVAKDHRLALELFVNMGIGSIDVTNETIARGMSIPGKDLKMGDKGFFQYKSTSRASMPGGVNTSGALFDLGIETEQNQALKAAGIFVGTLKEEQKVSGKATTIKTSMRFGGMSSETGSRFDETLHQRPISIKSQSKVMTRNFIDGDYQIMPNMVTDPYLHSLDLAHAEVAKSRTGVNFKINAVGSTGTSQVNFMSLVVSGPESRVLTEGNIILGTKSDKNGLREISRFGSLTIKGGEEGSVTGFSIGSGIEGEVGLDSSKYLKQAKKLTKKWEKAKGKSAKWKLNALINGEVPGVAFKIKKGDMLQLNLSSTSEDGVVTHFVKNHTFEQEVVSNGIKQTAMKDGLEVLTEITEDMADTASRLTMGVKGHVSTAYHLSEVQEGILKSTMKGMEKLSPVGMASVGVKPIDMFHLAVSQFIHAPVAIAGTQDKSTVEVIKDRFDTLRGVLRRHGLDPEVYNKSIDHKMPTRSKLILSDPNIEDLIEAKEGALPDLLKDLRTEHGKYINKQLGTTGDEGLKLFPILTGIDALDVPLQVVDKGIDGAEDTVRYNSMAVPLAQKTTSNVTTTGMASDYGSSSRGIKLSSEIIAGMENKGLDRVTEWLNDVQAKSSKGGKWIGAIASQYFSDPSVVKEAGGLQGFLANRLPELSIGNVDDYLKDAGTDVNLLRMLAEKHTLPPGLDTSAAEKLLEGKRGYVIDLHAGMPEEIVDKMNFTPIGNSTKSSHEVLVTPIGQIQATGSDGNVIVSPHDKKQIANVNKLFAIQKEMINNPSYVDKGVSDIQKVMEDMHSSMDYALKGKEGAAADLISGPRVNVMSGYQDIQDSENIVRAAMGDDYKKGSNESGFYRKTADGFESIDSRMTTYSNIESLGTGSTTTALKSLSNKVDLKENKVYIKQGGEYKVAGASTMGLKVAYPTSSSQVLVSEDLYLFPKKLSAKQAAMLGVAKADTIGFKALVGKKEFTSGVNYMPYYMRRWMNRDLDADSIGTISPGGVRPEDAGVQEQLRDFMHAKREGKLLDYNSAYAEILDDGVGSIKAAGNLQIHDLVGDNVKELEDILKSTVQKRNTPLLTTALEARLEYAEETIHNPGKLKAVFDAMTPANRASIQSTLSTPAELSSFIRALMASEKQVTINKGFGSFLLYSNLTAFHEGVTATTQGKIQGRMTEGLTSMYAGTGMGAEAVLTLRQEAAKDIHDMLITGVGEVRNSKSFQDRVKTHGPKATKVLDELEAKLKEPEAWKNMDKVMGKIANVLVDDNENIATSPATTLDQARAMGAAAREFTDLVKESGASTASITPASGSFNANAGTMRNQEKGVIEAMGNVANGGLDTPGSEAYKEAAGLDRNLEANYSTEGDIRRSSSINSSPSVVDDIVEDMAKANKAKASPGKEKARAAAKGMAGIGEALKHMYNNVGTSSYDVSKGSGKLVEEATNIFKNNKRWFAGAAAGAAVLGVSHVVGAINSPSTSITDSPLPPGTPLDDGAMLATPQFDVSPGPPTVRVANELPSLNSTDVNYSGADAVGGIVQDVDQYFTNSTFIHDGRTDFNRGSMNTYRQEQATGRF